MRDGHLLKRAGREFAKNMIWMAVVFGSLAAILAAVTDLSLVGVMVFVGVSVAVMVAIVTVGVLWSGAHDETRLGSHDYPGSPPEARGSDWPGGMVAEETVAVDKAAFTPNHLLGHGG
jgi:hypothetical protein